MPHMPHYLSPQQAAEELGVSLSTLWRWIREGKLHSEEIAGRTVIPRPSLASAPEPKNIGRRAAKRAT